MVNNYIKINIGEKEVGLLFGLLQVKEFELALVGNLDLYFDANQSLTEAGLTKLIYTASQNARFTNANETAVTPDEIYKWIISGRTDESVKNQVVETVKVWYASQEVKNWLEEKKKEAAMRKKSEIENSQQSKTPKRGTKKSNPGFAQKGSTRKK
jgi:hypothetical protein